MTNKSFISNTRKTIVVISLLDNSKLCCTHIISWAYDCRGNCSTTTNFLGATKKFRYDNLNRLIRANLSDDNDVQLQYNAYDEVVFAKVTITGMIQKQSWFNLF